MFDLWQRIKDFFLSLVITNREDLRKRKELGKIQGAVKRTKPPLIKIANKELLRGFASTMYTFYNLLRPIDLLFEKTIHNTDEKMSTRFKNYLVERNVSEELAEKRYNYTFESMKKRVLNSANPEDERKTISNEFNSLLKSINEPVSHEIDSELFEVFLLAEICKLPWETLFCRFDIKAQIKNPGYKPEFTPVQGQVVLNLLMDIYYEYAVFHADERLKKNLLHLAERVSVNSETTSKQHIEKTVNQLSRFMSKKMPPSLLLDIIRLIKNDPYLNIQTDKPKTSYASAYRTRITNSFRRDIDKISRHLRESYISKELNEIFGKNELLTLNGYNDEENRLIASVEQNTFSMIKPLRIIKTFVVIKYQKAIRESVNKIIVNGFFDNKTFQNDFSDVYYRSEKSFDRIVTFEEERTSPGRLGIETVHKYIDEYKKGGRSINLLNKVIDEINLDAKECVENETNVFFNLGNMLYAVLNDYKKPAPELVTNIKSIEGKGNKEFIAGLIRQYNDISKFIKVMKNFAVIRESKRQYETG